MSRRTSDNLQLLLPIVDVFKGIGNDRIDSPSDTVSGFETQGVVADRVAEVCSFEPNLDLLKQIDAELQELRADLDKLRTYERNIPYSEYDTRKETKAEIAQLEAKILTLCSKITLFKK